MHIFRCIVLSSYWWQESDIWSQASYRYAILWEAFLDPSDSYFLYADFVDFYTRWTYMRIFLSNYWWQKFDIWSQASYRYPILWEAFFEPSDSYFLFSEERGYHRWALAHSSSCFHLSDSNFTCPFRASGLVQIFSILFEGLISILNVYFLGRNKIFAEKWNSSSKKCTWLFC